MRRTVVFPEPEGPRIANSSPSATVRSALSTATMPLPNSFRTPISSTCGFRMPSGTLAADPALIVPEDLESMAKSYELDGHTAVHRAFGTCLCSLGYLAVRWKILMQL